MSSLWTPSGFPEGPECESPVMEWAGNAPKSKGKKYLEPSQLFCSNIRGTSFLQAHKLAADDPPLRSRGQLARRGGCHHFGWSPDDGVGSACGMSHAAGSHLDNSLIGGTKVRQRFPHQNMQMTPDCLNAMLAASAHAGERTVPGIYFQRRYPLGLRCRAVLKTGSV